MGRPNDVTQFEHLALLHPIKARDDLLFRALSDVPQDMLLVHYSRHTVPGRFLSSIGFEANFGSFCVHGLPENLAMELQLSLWLIISRGGRITPSAWSLLADSLRLMCEPMLRSSAPATSLMDKL